MELGEALFDGLEIHQVGSFPHCLCQDFASSEIHIFSASTFLPTMNVCQKTSSIAKHLPPLQRAMNVPKLALQAGTLGEECLAMDE